MAKPPTLKKLLVEDFPQDQQQWIGPLLQTLNQFMEETYFNLNRNVAVKENVLAQVRDLSFTGNATLIGTLTDTTTTITNCSSTVGLSIGMVITARSGIPANTTITNIVGSTITMSNAATATALGETIIVGNNFPINFKYSLNGKPVGLWIVDAQEDSNNPNVLNQPMFPDWELINGNVVINHITGCRADTKYKIKVIVLGE